MSPGEALSGRSRFRGTVARASCSRCWSGRQRCAFYWWKTIGTVSHFCGASSRSPVMTAEWWKRRRKQSRLAPVGAPIVYSWTYDCPTVTVIPLPHFAVSWPSRVHLGNKHLRARARRSQGLDQRLSAQADHAGSPPAVPGLGSKATQRAVYDSDRPVRPSKLATASTSSAGSTGLARCS